MKRKHMMLITVSLLIYICSQLFSGCAIRVPKESGDESSSPGSISENIESEDFTLEEITVTSKKMEAELKEIPMNVDPIKPNDIKRMNVQQVSELQKIPNLKPNIRTLIKFFILSKTTAFAEEAYLKKIDKNTINKDMEVALNWVESKLRTGFYFEIDLSYW